MGSTPRAKLNHFLVRLMPKKESKRGVCHYHLCKKRTIVYKCKFCGKYFCKEHLNPKSPLLPPFKRVGRKAISDMENWRDKGHPDPFYAEYLENKKREDLQKRKEALDRMRKLPPTPVILPPAPPKRKINPYLIALIAILALILFRVFWFYFMGK